MTGLYGGSFDPPHNGHVALADAARRRFSFDRFVVLVGESPGPKPAVAPADVRVRMALAAFPGLEVELDPFPYTVDMLRARAWDDPMFLIGADQLVGFASWKEPEAVLELARLGVATRPGYLVAARDGVEVFEIPPFAVSSSEVRRRLAVGEPIDDLVPSAVAELIEETGVYRH